LILYLDTSALVKLYARERGSADVRRQVTDAEAVATSVVAYAEARAAFARLLRERPVS
jgi:predicted nucleic acid-binding protein